MAAMASAWAVLTVVSSAWPTYPSSISRVMPGGQRAGAIGDDAVIGGVDVAQILGIEARRQRRRTDQVAEHHGQLPASACSPDASIVPWSHWLGRPNRRPSAREIKSQRRDRG
jgi:hypothetical protein